MFLSDRQTHVQLKTIVRKLTKTFLILPFTPLKVADREAKQRSTPLLIKKMYVLSGLLVEQYRDLVKAGGILPSKAKVAQREQASKALDGLLSEESTIAISDSKLLDNAWRGAEAYHFMMLCQRQLRLELVLLSTRVLLYTGSFFQLVNYKFSLKLQKLL